MHNIKILVVEDEPLIAEDIRESLTNINYEVVAIAYSKEEALEALEIKQLDLVVLDINLGNNSLQGIEIGEIINNKYFLPFIYLTSYSGKQIVEQAKHTKPLGYVVKPFTEGELFSTIEIALYNYAQKNKPKHFSRNFINQIIANPITEKEFEVLQDLYQGIGNVQIADKHFLSVNTIKSHVKNIYTKLNCHSRTEVITFLRDKLV